MVRRIPFFAFVLLCVIIVFEYSNIDVWLQDYFYDFDSNRWLLSSDDTLARLIFYDGIKVVLIVFFLIMLTGLVLFWKNKLICEYRLGLVIMLLSSLIIPSVVGGLKSISNTPCPVNITRYGGDYPYVTFLKSYPKDFQQQGKVRCFPAGHASGGFALLALFFLFKTKRNRIIALVSAMSVGWAMGIYKMLIGDHFLGHTVVTMILAWLIILLIAKGVHSYSETIEN